MIGTSVMKELRGHRGRRYIDPAEPLILKTLTLHYKQVWMWQSIIHIVNLSLVMSYIHETLKMKMCDKEITG